MEVICLEEEAFFNLVNRVIEHIGINTKEENWKWVGEEKAMELLNIKSKTTLQELRVNDDIRFTQPRKKLIAYDRVSIEEYMAKHANKK